MSESEETPYAGTEESSTDEKGKEIMAEEEKQVQAQQQKEEVKRQPKKNKAEPKRREKEISIADLSNNLKNKRII
jgi:hypothetical protein